MATNDHGICPNCKVSLTGSSIWQHFYDEFTTKGDWQDKEGKNRVGRTILTSEEAEIRADEVSGHYGATREVGTWGRAVGIYSREKDRTVAWKCPDCEHEWAR